MNGRGACPIGALAFACVASSVASSSIAQARSIVKLPYARADVWATTVRLLRVDGGLPVREKDEAAGYVLFDYLDGTKTYRGSFELLSVVASPETSATEIILTIGELPRRFETSLLDRLIQKLRQERGAGGPGASLAPSGGREKPPTPLEGAAPVKKPGADGGIVAPLPRLEGQPE